MHTFIYGSFSFVEKDIKARPFPPSAFESERPSSQNGLRVRTAFESERPLSQNGL